ncbi:MAG: transcription termination factor NusA [Candidatus Woykebacteria bacterium GWB1_45_5]|uniref:Transcription termination/antitermination protein NusA n=2 Tax=Candidatus Woykeibacteriota TaxID=1817899 RepID=A0A1G1W0W1_9BACT|nr:MAG: transcription termination factor NusA [Candidatus Woykebacteria bacterium GWA1_44_8]OGY23678.1 MAG: transcription termination factor NusA [Candidatus Woykebacteria bacterium GWB1_45_5]
MALRTEFSAALNQAAAERGVEPEDVLAIIKEAIKAAYKKDYGGETEDVNVEIDHETGETKVFKNKKDVTPPGFGRIAAQTAKQVLLQRIREAEKMAIFSEYEKRIGSIVNGMIQRIEGLNFVVDIGKTEAIMPANEKMTGEDYRLNQRLKFYIVGIREDTRGREIIVSRAHKGLVEGLFKLEVPEIGSGVVEIKGIAREAGSRSKVAVASRQTGVDPVGSCVGQKGVRVQAVIAELGVEKIDVIAYSSDPAKFVAAALSPAKVEKVRTEEATMTAYVEVPEDQLSLAIGKDGQNVRLAAKLTGWRIDIKGAEKIQEVGDKTEEKTTTTEAQKTKARKAKGKIRKETKTRAKKKETKKKAKKSKGEE